MKKHYLFTSESVSEGHPDKLADLISDTVLDLFLEHAPNSRCAVETLVKTGIVIVAGEVGSSYTPGQKLEDRVREAIIEVGYDDVKSGFDGRSCEYMNLLGRQSKDIQCAVDGDGKKDLGAGDQGLMFGYANNETEELMPAPILLAHNLVRRQAEVRKKNILPWLRPDAKSQVTVQYDGGKRVGLEAVVLSTQHADGVCSDVIEEGVREEILKPVLRGLITNKVKIHINPSGRFVIGGPEGDCGLTGRKIIVDTYGGMARHGGGAFSGKDPSKVDRSAAYAARYAAKNIVAAGLAERCEIQLSYAIGVAEPTSIAVNSFGTGDDQRIERLISPETGIFDLTPQGIIDMLDLKRPIYAPTAAYGHFGRTDQNFSWEKTDRIDALQQA